MSPFFASNKRNNLFTTRRMILDRVVLSIHTVMPVLSFARYMFLICDAFLHLNYGMLIALTGRKNMMYIFLLVYRLSSSIPSRMSICSTSLQILLHIHFITVGLLLRREVCLLTTRVYRFLRAYSVTKIGEYCKVYSLPSYVPIKHKSIQTISDI